MAGTEFSTVYDAFLSKITDDMYMELTKEDTYKLLKELLVSSLPYFEFPRVSLEVATNDKFVYELSQEEVDIIATYMVANWVGQQLATVENTRMKYSGADFKFTSQAAHLTALLKLKEEYTQKGFHLQRLYKRRKVNDKGVYKSTMGSIIQELGDYYDN